MMMASTDMVNGPTTASAPVPMKVGMAVMDACAVIVASEMVFLIAETVSVVTTLNKTTPSSIAVG